MSAKLPSLVARYACHADAPLASLTPPGSGRREGRTHGAGSARAAALHARCPADRSPFLGRCPSRGPGPAASARGRAPGALPLLPPRCQRPVAAGLAPTPSPCLTADAVHGAEPSLPGLLSVAPVFPATGRYANTADGRGGRAVLSRAALGPCAQLSPLSCLHWHWHPPAFPAAQPRRCAASPRRDPESGLMSLTFCHFCRHSSHSTAVGTPNHLFPLSLPSPLVRALSIGLPDLGNKHLQCVLAHSRCSRNTRRMNRLKNNNNNNTVLFQCTVCECG